MHIESRDAQRYIMVDGSIARLASISELLKKFENRLVEGKRALEILTSISPDDFPALILLQVFKDRAEEISHCAQLASCDGRARIPVAVIGPTDSPELRVECFRAGATDYIDNSSGVGEIEIRLRAHLNEKGTQCLVAVSDAASEAIVSRSHEIYRLALQYLSNMEVEEIPKQLLAQRIGVSVANLDAAFRSATGFSVVKFLKRRRLERACTLLKGSSMSITAIAELLGFSDSANFSTAFRLSIGETPSRFRDSCGFRTGAAL